MFLDRERRRAGRVMVRIVDRVVRNSADGLLGWVRVFVRGSADRRVGRLTL